MEHSLRNMLPSIKNMGPKACKIWVDFYTNIDIYSKYLWNESICSKSERHFIENDCSSLRQKVLRTFVH